MKAIVAVNNEWGIGNNGELLFHISADLKRFKALTINNTVIYGRKTLETFPGKRPLSGRRNIVLSRQEDLHIDGAEVCGSIEQVMAILHDDEDVYIIGGASVYTAFLPLCTSALITKIYEECPADCFFENLDANPDWAVSQESEIMQDNGPAYQFIEYTRSTRSNI